MAIAIQAEKRSGLGKGAAHRLRVSGFIPGILYGLGDQAMPLQVSQKLMEDSFRQPETMHQVIELSLAEGGAVQKKTVLLKDYQADIMSRRFTHVDFYEIEPSHKVTVKVPVRLTGRAIGVKQGGTLQPLLRHMAVQCLPKDIPSIVEYDVTDMGIGHVVHLRSVQLPDGVELAPHAGEIALVSITGKAEEEAPAPAAAPAAPAKKK